MLARRGGNRAPAQRNRAAFGTNSVRCVFAPGIRALLQYLAQPRNVNHVHATPACASLVFRHEELNHESRVADLFPLLSQQGSDLAHADGLPQDSVKASGLNLMIGYPVGSRNAVHHLPG